MYQNSLEGYTMSNPVHTSETRMCGDRNNHPLYPAWKAVHSESANQVQPSRLI